MSETATATPEVTITITLRWVDTGGKVPVLTIPGMTLTFGPGDGAAAQVAPPVPAVTAAPQPAKADPPADAVKHWTADPVLWPDFCQWLKRNNLTVEDAKATLKVEDWKTSYPGGETADSQRDAARQVCVDLGAAIKKPASPKNPPARPASAPALAMHETWETGFIPFTEAISATFDKSAEEMLQYVERRDWRKDFPNPRAAWAHVLQIAAAKQLPIVSTQAHYHEIEIKRGAVKSKAKVIDLKTPLGDFRLFGGREVLTEKAGVGFANKHVVEDWSPGDPYLIDPLKIVWVQSGEKREISSLTPLVDYGAEVGKGSDKDMADVPDDLRITEEDRATEF